MHFHELKTERRALWLILVALFLLMPCAAYADAPADPYDLVATAVTGSQITLTWKDSVDVDQFYVEIQSTYSWHYYNLPGDARSWTFDDLAPGTEYLISIIAYNAANEYSSQVSTTVTTIVIPPPSILSTVPVSTTEIEVTWTDNRTDEAWFEFEIVGGAYSPRSLFVYPDTTSYVIPNLYPNTLYTFRVQSCDASYHCTSFSEPAQATTKSDSVAPDLMAVALSSKRVKLTWTDPTTNETAYYVEFQKGNNGSFTILQQLPANTITYTHTNLDVGASYTYRVRSFNGSYYGPYSDAVTVATSECVTEGPYIK
jgi:titin